MASLIRGDVAAALRAFETCNKWIEYPDAQCGRFPLLTQYSVHVFCPNDHTDLGYSKVSCAGKELEMSNQAFLQLWMRLWLGPPLLVVSFLPTWSNTKLLIQRTYWCQVVSSLARFSRIAIFCLEALSAVLKIVRAWIAFETEIDCNQVPKVLKRVGLAKDFVSSYWKLMDDHLVSIHQIRVGTTVVERKIGFDRVEREWCKISWAMKQRNSRGRVDSQRLQTYITMMMYVYLGPYLDVAQTHVQDSMYEITSKQDPSRYNKEQGIKRRMDYRI